MAGAFGAYAAGYGATDMAAIIASGETWLAVPHTLRAVWSGAFARGVVAKDVMLFLCRTLGLDNAFTAIEYCGPTIAAMTMPERMVLCNMAAELGCDTGVIAPDRVTFDYLRARGAPVADESAAAALASDPQAACRAEHRFDAGALAPQIALPHSPANSVAADELDRIRIDQAYIGACVGAKLSDLRMAAEVLRGPPKPGRRPSPRACSRAWWMRGPSCSRQGAAPAQASAPACWRPARPASRRLTVTSAAAWARPRRPSISARRIRWPRPQWPAA